MENWKVCLSLKQLQKLRSIHVVDSEKHDGDFWNALQA